MTELDLESRAWLREQVIALSIWLPRDAAPQLADDTNRILATLDAALARLAEVEAERDHTNYAEQIRIVDKELGERVGQIVDLAAENARLRQERDAARARLSATNAMRPVVEAAPAAARVLRAFFSNHWQNDFPAANRFIAAIDTYLAQPADTEPGKDPGAFHSGRSWSDHHLEDACPCPKEPCGLVNLRNADPDCPEHPLMRAKTIRQSHLAVDCPGPHAPAEPVLCRAEYQRPGGDQRGDRIVRCGLPKGHAQDHDEMINGEPGNSWPREPAPTEPAPVVWPERHASPRCACGTNGAGEPFVDPICRTDVIAEKTYEGKIEPESAPAPTEPAGMDAAIEAGREAAMSLYRERTSFPNSVATYPREYAEAAVRAAAPHLQAAALRQVADEIARIWGSFDHEIYNWLRERAHQTERGEA